MFGADDPMGASFRGGFAAMYHRATYDVTGGRGRRPKFEMGM